MAKNRKIWSSPPRSSRPARKNQKNRKQSHSFLDNETRRAYHCSSGCELALQLLPSRFASAWRPICLHAGVDSLPMSASNEREPGPSRSDRVRFGTERLGKGTWATSHEAQFLPQAVGWGGSA